MSLKAPIMTRMANTKLTNAMRLLVELERCPQSSWKLAKCLDISRPTVVRLVAEVRELGCDVMAVPVGNADWSYHLGSWGVFDPVGVKLFLGDKK